jgi:hypothetical protein
MWLCKLIGHKHVQSDSGYARHVLGYCLRCHANVLTPSGDGVLICVAFGHKTEDTIVGDYRDDTATLRGEQGGIGCFRCHALAGGN